MDKLTMKEKRVQAYYKLDNIIFNIVITLNPGSIELDYLKCQEIINLITTQQNYLLNLIKPEANTKELIILKRYIKENNQALKDTKKTFKNKNYTPTITKEYALKYNLFNIKDCFVIN